MSPAPGKCIRLALGLGATAWCPRSLNKYSFNWFEGCWENVPIWNPGSLESSLPLLLGARRRTAFCRHLGGCQAQVSVRQAVPSPLPTCYWSSQGGPSSDDDSWVEQIGKYGVRRVTGKKARQKMPPNFSCFTHVSLPASEPPLSL